MFVCSQCGQEFSTPWIVREYHGELERQAEWLSVSPCCAEGVVPAVRCCSCGEWTAEQGVEHGVCPRCAGRVVERLRQLLKSEFSQQEREVINDAFEAVPLTQVESIEYGGI